MKSTITIILLLSIRLCFSQITLTQTLNNTIQQGSVICSAGQFNDNVYMRAFDISNLGYQQFNVFSVDFGIYSAINQSGTYTVEVIIYQTDSFPDGALTLMASTMVPVSSADDGTLKHVPIEATITDNILVFAVSAENPNVGGNLDGMIIGSNSNGQTAPSYYLSNSCGYNMPTDITTLFPPPEIHLVMQVTGDERLSLDELQLSQVNIYPNPTNGIVKIERRNLTDLKSTTLFDMAGKLIYQGNTHIIDMTQFDSGVYMLIVTGHDGTKAIKRIVKQ